MMLLYTGRERCGHCRKKFKATDIADIRRGYGLADQTWLVHGRCWNQYLATVDLDTLVRYRAFVQGHNGAAKVIEQIDTLVRIRERHVDMV